MAAERIGWIELSLVTGMIVLVESLTVLAGRWMPSVAPMILTGIARVLEIALIFLIFRADNGDAPAIGLGAGDVRGGFFRGCLWSAGFGLLVAAAGLIMVIAGHSPLKAFRVALPEDGFQTALRFLVGGIIGPVAEECYFRGVLFGFFRSWGAPLAVIASTACFVLLHPNVGITQAVGGLLFAVSYEMEKTLWVPIVIHAAGNLALFSLSFIG